MKRIVLGGFAFVGGAVMYSISTLGFAHVEVQLYCRPPGFTRESTWLAVCSRVALQIQPVCSINRE